MSTELTRWLEKQLKPGYRLEITGNTAHFYDPNGKMLRTEETGQPVIVKVGVNTYHYRRRIVQNLREVGAVLPLTQRTAKAVHEPRKLSESTLRVHPGELARAVMMDAKSSPRERALAKEVLRQYDVMARAQTLIQELSERLKEFKGANGSNDS